MNPIRIEHLSKHWGEVRALDDVSFEVPKGSLTVLLGPSGCGKSTLLRLVAGLDRPTSGRIVIDGVDVTLLPPHQRRISMVFQFYALFPHLTVAENITFGLRIRRLDAKTRDERLRAVASLLGLTALLDRRPSQLSGGQQQRVAMGRAIIAEAPVCLMDEPLSNLDAQLRGEMRREIRALQQRLGITMVYVTHDQTEAMTMADRIVLLRAGKIEQVGSPDELYTRPATTFTAGFIGAPPMNLMKLNGAATVTGVRPEDMRLGSDGLAARVESIEYLGADSLVAASSQGQSILVRVPGKTLARAGEEVSVAWDASAEHHFDAQTGGRKP